MSARFSHAFTLVEVLAALAFLGILLPVILSALLAANHAGSLSERTAVAAQLGENELAELQLDNAWSTSGQTSGDFGADYPGYRWELAQQDWPSVTGSGLTELTLTVHFDSQGRDHQIALTTLADPSAASASSSSSSPP